MTHSPISKKVIILDFGSQYTQLIARRVRELEVFCEIRPFDKNIDIEEVSALILSGSPFSVNDDKALIPSIDHLIGKVPILAICYGAQYFAKHLGGEVARSEKREFGKAKINLVSDNRIWESISDEEQVWMSHGDSIKSLPSNAQILAKTNDIPVAAYQVGDDTHPIIGLQFHPEVTHTLRGSDILSNFLTKIAGVNPDWTPAQFVTQTVSEIKETVGNDEEVILGLSGGVDSSVAAMLLKEAIGDNLKAIFVNNGLLRKNEFEEVLESYESMGLNVKGVDASQEFYDQLSGVSDPEQKRKIIGKVFVDVFERESKAYSNAKWLGQGTIYPDVIESVSVHGPSVTIKSHHNVGGLPDKLSLQVIEPLRMLFKDEVRKVGRELGLPSNILNRHPFPGPGLAIRILGEITPSNVALLQEADHIYLSTLKEHGWYDKIWQAGTILLPLHSVGVMGDERTYEKVVALRAVNSLDGMTAEWTPIPYDILAEISSKIINRVKGINRVVYDISTKPPSTIEWE